MNKMLRLFTVIAMLTLTYSNANAQLPNGSIAPNFTVTDIDGNSHTLYDYLDAGIPVVLDISATWCGPCWAYHTGMTNGFNGEGALHHVYNTNGPDGTNEVMVFMIEADATTTLDDLNGTGNNTQGDWVTGTPYPIVDDASIFDLYQCTYYPTIYTICPNRVLTESGQATYEDHLAIIQNNACAAATLPVDPSLVSYSGTLASCSDVDVVVNMMNLGTDPLTSAQITVNGCDNCPIVEDWTGNLLTYETENVTILGSTISSSTNFEITITSPNDDTSNDTINQLVDIATEGTTEVHVDILTDCWPEETSWDLVSNGTVVASGGPYDANTQVTTEINEVLWVDPACYEFRFHDLYGDGLHGEQWSACGVDGWAKCSTWDNGTQVSVVYYYDGSYDVLEEFAGVNVNSVVSVEDLSIQDSFKVYPNPVNDVAVVAFTTSLSTKATVDVMNMLGQSVLSQDLGTVVSGTHRMDLDFGGLDAGIYLVNLTANGQVSTVKVTVAH